MYMCLSQVCEHRWHTIANMAAWRNAAGGEYTGVDNWWDNGNNQIAFSRNGAAFIAFNTEVRSVFQTRIERYFEICVSSLKIFLKLCFL